jgi:hypothetical protein
MPLHTPRDKIEFVREQQHTLSIRQQLAIALHGSKATIETLERFISGEPESQR